MSNRPRRWTEQGGMYKPNLRFMILAALSAPALGCGNPSNDSGSALSAFDETPTTTSSSGGVSTTAATSTETVGAESFTTVGSGGASIGTTVTTTGSGANVAASGSGGGSGGALPSSDDASPITSPTAGAAGDTGEPNVGDEPAEPAVPNLLITEYVEGSSNNKAIEITNVGAGLAAIADCTLQIYYNSKTKVGSQVALGLAMTAGQSLVVCNAKSDESVLARCDITSGVASFNGDDALVLLCADQVIDSFGQVGDAPDGGTWGNEEVSSKLQTLRRICGDDARRDPNQPFAPEDSFVSFKIDTFDDLGSYACDL